MGVVYRATQLRLTRMVALKVVTPALARDPSFRERFRREWMVAASIDHPNVIPVYEAGEEDGILFIAMRWVEGTNLRDEIDGGPLEPGRAAHLVSQVGSALDAAHERDLIHRDIKPANILITGQDHVYLTDFGLTKHASSISSLTKTGQWMGTVDYTAPEQIEGTSVTPATDVYSLGCVLFEALSGRAPYKRENDLATLWAHVYAPPPSLREVDPGAPAALDEVVQRAMSKDPANRFESAGELGRAAVGAARGEVVPAPQRVAAPPATSNRAPSTAGDRREPWRPSRRALYGLGGLLAALAAVAAIVLIAGSGSDQPETDRAGAIPSARLKAASPWRPLPPMPTPRQNMGSTVVDGTIWVVGGLGGGSIGSRRVEGFDPVVNGWKVGPDLPVRLHHEMVVTYKGELVVMGGWEPKRSDPAWGDLRSGLRAAGWRVGAPAFPQPAACGRRSRSRRQPDSGGGRPDGPQSDRHDRGVRRRAMDCDGCDPDSARAPRGGVGWAIRIRRRWTGVVARQEHCGARALRPGPRQMGPACRHADCARRPCGCANGWQSLRNRRGAAYDRARRRRVLQHRQRNLVGNVRNAHTAPWRHRGGHRSHALLPRGRTTTRPRKRVGDLRGAPAYALNLRGCR